MALAFTEQVELNYKAPEFNLYEPLTDTFKSLDDLKSNFATVLMFICNHCPYVKHVNPELVKLANDYIPKGISFIAINPNDVINYPDDSPEKMIELATNMQFPFPYLFDETQETAKAYKAVCTPDFSIFNTDMLCVYRGQLDESRPGNNEPLNGKSIRNALDAILNNKPIPEPQIPSSGCSIKWK